ncbi:MAG TPA: DMT family transporter [Oscillospiraceae bacterium]|nr:DMT family transporter [Oscillospiraceae bacterium]
MKTKEKLQAVFAIFVTTVFWGLSYSSTKVLLGTLLPAQIAFYRLLIACAALGLLFLATHKKSVQRKDLLRVMAGGFFGNFIYFLFENNGLRFTTAGMGSLIIATIPVLNVLVGAIIFKEKSNPQRWLGVLLSFIGVYLLIRSGHDGELSFTSLKGNLLVFGAACTWVIYTRLNEPLLQNYDSMVINLYQAATGMFLLSGLALPQSAHAVLLQPEVAFNLLYLGIFCSAVAYFFYLYALQKLGAAAVTSFLNLIPVFGVLGGAVLLKETLVTGQLLGGAIVIVGVSLVTMTGKAQTQQG